MVTLDVIMRVDCTIETGRGHFSRSLVLAQALKCQGVKVAWMGALDELAQHRLGSSGIINYTAQHRAGSPADADALVKLVRELSAAAAVLDNYAFDPHYQRYLFEQQIPCALFDDIAHHSAYNCDVIINHNPYATQSLYPMRSDHTRLLLGGAYTLLREEFTKKSNIAISFTDIVITLGGGDVGQWLQPLIQMVTPLLASYRAKVLLSGIEQNRNVVKELDNGNSRIEWLFDAADIAAQMAHAAVAITAGGTSCWELASQGVPMVVMQLADNQRLVAEYIASQNVGVNLGQFDIIDSTEFQSTLRNLLGAPQMLKAMAENASALVTPNGADTLGAALITLFKLKERY
jgi:UDP-2,4-diacetamido-2,4,6-trideoxy-beta-L-altropyranose hydrolase